MVELLALTLLLGLSTWRLSSLLYTEDACEWLREWIGISHDADKYPVIYPGTFWGKVFGCFWCLTLVVAVPVTPLGLLLARQDMRWWPLVALASGAVAIWTEKQVMRAQSR